MSRNHSIKSPRIIFVFIELYFLQYYSRPSDVFPTNFTLDAYHCFTIFFTTVFIYEEKLSAVDELENTDELGEFLFILVYVLNPVWTRSIQYVVLSST
jgi:hypothetical protein